MSKEKLEGEKKIISEKLDNPLLTQIMELHMFKSSDSIPFALIPYGSFTSHCTSTRVLSAASLNTVIFKTQAFFLLLLLFSPNRLVSYIFRNIAEVRHTATSQYSLFSTHLTLFQGLQLALCTLMLFRDCITVIIF